MNKTVKYALFLIVLGIICGGLLALVNSFTAPIIDERKIEEQTKDLRVAFDFEKYSLSQKSEFKNLGKSISDVFYAFGEDGKVTAVIYVTVASGYSSQVTSFVAINADGTIHDVVVGPSGVSGESSGFGKEIPNHDFGLQDKSINDYVFTVKSGVTITSNAVKSGLVDAIAHFKTIQSTLGGITNE